MPNKSMGALAVLGLILMSMVSCGVMMARADAPRGSDARSAARRISDQPNPMAYLYGAAIDGSVFGPSYDSFTNVRFQPSHTPLLYDISILFCGDESAAFQHATGPIVVTYRKLASRSYGGIGCHELISVDRVSTL